MATNPDQHEDEWNAFISAGENNEEFEAELEIFMALPPEEQARIIAEEEAKEAQRKAEIAARLEDLTSAERLAETASMTVGELNERFEEIADCFSDLNPLFTEDGTNPFTSARNEIFRHHFHDLRIIQSSDVVDNKDGYRTLLEEADRLIARLKAEPNRPIYSEEGHSEWASGELVALETFAGLLRPIVQNNDQR